MLNECLFIYKEKIMYSVFGIFDDEVKVFISAVAEQTDKKITEQELNDFFMALVITML